MIKRYGYSCINRSFGELENGDYVLFTDHEAALAELSYANKALGKKCTDLEEARDRNAELYEEKERENGKLREEWQNWQDSLNRANDKIDRLCKILEDRG